MNGLTDESDYFCGSFCTCIHGRNCVRITLFFALIPSTELLAANDYTINGTRSELMVIFIRIAFTKVTL